jgi:hypothetical protein
MQYFQYENESVIPARWDKAGTSFPEIWSGPERWWTEIRDPVRWATHASRISKKKFDELWAAYPETHPGGEPT